MSEEELALDAPVRVRPRRGGGVPTSGRRATHGLRAGTEIVTGGLLIGAVAALGAYFSSRPGATGFDRWGLDKVGFHTGTAVTAVTSLRYPVALVACSVALAAAVVWRDRLRALACLLGPPLALLTCETVVKPLVGRTAGPSLSYPSGTTVAAAALATAVVLATPTRWRLLSGALGVFYVLSAMVAVLALRWHLPTDALAGAAYGIGVVLVVDGLIWSGAHLVGRRPVGSPMASEATAGAGARERLSG